MITLKKLIARLGDWFDRRAPFLATLILLIFIPLYPKFPLLGVKHTWVAIRLEDLVVAGAILVWGFVEIKSSLPSLKTRVGKLFILFWVAGLISALSAILITDLVRPHLVLLHWLRRIEYMGVFFVAWLGVRSLTDLKELLVGVYLTAILVFIYGWGQKNWGWPVISTMNPEFAKGRLLYLDRWTRISSTFAGHYDLAAWLMMLLSFAPVSFYLWQKGKQRLGLGVVFIFSFYLLVLTASRISFGAYLIGISVTLVGLRLWYWWPVVIFGSLFLGLQFKELNARLATNFTWVKRIPRLAQVIPYRYQPITQSPLKPTVVTPTPVVSLPKVTPGLSPTGIAKKPAPPKKKIVRTWPTPEEAAVAAQRSSAIRFVVEWPRAWRAFLKNPILGTGYSSLGLATDNDYLRLLGESGILGTMAFGLIILHLVNTFFQTVWYRQKNWQLAAGFLGVLAGILANACFIDVFEASKVAFYFWLLMGMGYRLIFWQANEPGIKDFKEKNL